MRTSLHSKYIRNLTPGEYKQLYKKNFGFDGYMRDDLIAAWNGRKGSEKARAIMIKDEAKRIIAWALIQPEKPGKNNKASVMLWVCQPYRRQGYGTRLMYHARKLDVKPRVFPHDPKSGKFFKSVGEVRMAPHERVWLKADA